MDVVHNGAVVDGVEYGSMEVSERALLLLQLLLLIGLAFSPRDRCY